MLADRRFVLVPFLALFHTTLSLSETASNASTCPSRTVNYITHSLPQKCLATLRVGSNTTNADNATSPQDRASNTPPTTVVSDTTKEASYLQSEQVSPTVPTPEFVEVLEQKHDSSTTETAHGEDAIEGEVEASRSEDSDEDSPLENSNFMSFEEWKKQNLRRSGQSEHVGHHSQFDFAETRRRPPSLHNALDSLGDEVEIEIDFSGLVPEGPDPSTRESLDLQLNEPIREPSSSPASIQGRSRKQDAGTTCKERFNYASFDCAATVLKTNREAKSPNAVLVENKDAYMLNECHAQDKYLILELCNDISIDTIVLANFEFFSSTFRTFRISVSDRYPVKAERWLDLGVFEARNTREVQAFLIENPRIWARYLRIELLTHYGTEFYCPVSLVRVHGTTMLEEYKHDQDSNTLESLENEQMAIEPGSQASDPLLIPEAATVPAIEAVLPHPEVFNLELTENQSKTNSITKSKPSEAIDEAANHGDLPKQNEQSLAFHTAAIDAIASVISLPDTCSINNSITDSSKTALRSDNDEPKATDSGVADTMGFSSETTAYTPSTELGSPNVSLTTSQSSKRTTSNISSPSSSPSGKDSQKSVDISTAPNQAVPLNMNSTSTKSSSAPMKSSSTSASDRLKSTASTTQVASPAPTMQESFFKSVQKRLQMLEANSSLSLQYIEDQSRSLRDAFKKVEQRQLSKTTNFLDQLNSTVLDELREFRQQYDQLWQSTVIELELQRERYERDNEAINARLGILTDEVIFQRRMGILQMILILICLALVLFSRGSINNYLELPLVQNVLSRSQSTRWLNLSGADSPSSSPQITRPRSAHQLRAMSGVSKGHRRFQSEDSTTDTLSATDVYAPPTPVSSDERTEAEVAQDGSGAMDLDSTGEAVFEDPAFDPATIERPLTSPPILAYPERSESLPQEHESASNAHNVQDMSLSVGETPTIPKAMESNLSPVTKRLAWNLPSEQMRDDLA